MSLSAFEAALGYTFTDIAFLRQAMIHRSFVAEWPEEDSNERFEFLGDTILQLVVTEFIFAEYPDLPEGELAKIRAASVNRDVLYEIAEELGLGSHLMLGKGEEGSGGREKPSILADAMEAVLAGVFLDGGLDRCRVLIMRIWETLIRQRSTSPGRRDFKTRLQESLARSGNRPRYKISSDGPDHEKTFTASVSVDGDIRGTGVGKSKKEAEQHAAEVALVSLAADSQGDA
jgi:ribonuclease-3